MLQSGVAARCGIALSTKKNTKNPCGFCPVRLWGLFAELLPVVPTSEESLGRLRRGCPQIPASEPFRKT